MAVYAPELMLCVGDARVAGVPQRWWAVALPDGQLFEGARDAPIELGLDEGPGVEVVSPHGRSYIWTRKQAGHPRARCGRGRDFSIEGPFGFVDESAGYHARHTRWRWSAGIGAPRDGRPVAWNLVDGVHDAPRASERTVWVDGEPHEVEPVAFADDLSAVGDLRFTEWSAREDHTNRLVMRSDYRQPFGSFSGRATGGTGARVGLRCDGVARRALVAAITAALLLAGCGGGDSDDDGNAPARAQPLLGVTSGAVLNEGAPLRSEVRAMKASGVTALRAPFYWWTAQPDEGRAELRRHRPAGRGRVARGDRAAADRGRDAHLGGAAPEAAQLAAAGTKAYAAFLTALIGRYGPSGSFWRSTPTCRSCRSGTGSCGTSRTTCTTGPISRTRRTT